MSLLEDALRPAEGSPAVSAQAQVLLICVNYRKPTETRRFVSSVCEQTLDVPMEVIVVDNSPEPEIDSAEAQVKVFASGKNLGYFGGAAAALRDYLKYHPLPDWVIVSNPDVSLPDHDVLQKLLDSHRGDAAVIAPSIRTLNSFVEQNPYMRVRPTRWRMRMNALIFSHYPVDAVYQGLSWIKHRTLDGVTTQDPSATAAVSERIYAPHGSFIALHRSYFEKGGTLDYGAFLFGEEIFVAETARRLGLTVLFEPSIVIEHTERSTAHGLWNRETSRYRRQASRYLARHFF
ncbi:MAG: glycosyltransferase family 2 protein [Chloroflexi bacterium]|nr:MAG: glycosyltransferase family 2 protein [Chloroflexota bacterium]